MTDEREANNGWQPIETAPKDGGRIIVWVPDSRRHVFLGRWVGALDAFWLDAGDANTSATHWMPLPKAPPEV